MPKKSVSLGDMPPIEADIDLGSKDHLFAVIGPLILAMVVLPFVTITHFQFTSLSIKSGAL